jgi:hypothetical protein
MWSDRAVAVRMVSSQHKAGSVDTNWAHGLDVFVKPRGLAADNRPGSMSIFASSAGLNLHCSRVAAAEAVSASG